MNLTNMYRGIRLFALMSIVFATKENRRPVHIDKYYWSFFSTPNRYFQYLDTCFDHQVIIFKIIFSSIFLLKMITW